MATDRRLEKLVRKFQERQAAVAARQAELEAAVKLFRAVVEEELPALLQELGLEQTVLADGVTQVRRVEELTAAVSRRNQAAAARIFKRLKAGDLVRSCADFRFTAADKAAEAELLAWTREHKVPVETYSEVNTGSLKAWVREQLRLGRLQPADLEALGVFQRTVAVVKVKQET